MTEFEADLRARLTTLEFLLEVVMAQHFAGAPQQDQDAAFATIMRLMKTSSWTASDLSTRESDQLLRVAKLASDHAERILGKVALRADEIRRAKA